MNNLNFMSSVQNNSTDIFLNNLQFAKSSLE